tara:strand:+ start:2117 stop:2536 length:420 start_codon:yes stop_codon:yes gene_type:complete
VVNVYLDASVLYSILISDAHSDRVRDWLVGEPVLTFSLWTLTETSSALSHAQRTDRITAAERRRAEVEMDRLFSPTRPDAVIGPDDFLQARRLLERHEALRAPDALHLAIVERESWALATLDRRLAEAAVKQGVVLALS